MSELNFEEIKDCLRAKVVGGMSVSDAIEMLHQNGFTIVQSIKFIVEEYGVTLSEAKKMVSMHPVWREVVESAKPLHDELINALSDPSKLPTVVPSKPSTH